MRYTVAPGLYRLGAAGPRSPVLVTANYKLSFDHVRTAMARREAWILVLDTRGINVWCAAGMGTFGTAELVRRVREAGLENLVEHREVIVPQLGAPGVQAHVVEAEAGFKVSFGPVRAADLPAYLDAERRAAPAMRRVRFRLIDRLVLTPMELISALPKLLLFACGALLVQGLTSQGILFERALASGLPLALLGLLGVLAGSFLTPLLLPLVPGRAFAVKGALVGLAVAAAALLLAPAVRASGASVAVALLLVPATSSGFALAFTGCTTFTNISGVRRELSIAIPLYAVAAAAVLALLIVAKAQTWGVIV